MAKRTQKEKILDILADNNWHCVNEFASIYCIDYRKRLCEIRDGGIKLESRWCKDHDYHAGSQKQWRLEPKLVGVLF